MLLVLVVLVLPLLVIAGLLAEPFWRSRQRARALARPFPPEWREILRSRVPHFRRLPAHLQLEVKDHIRLFVAEKDFIGCAGQEITDEVRVTIAAQACLLLLGGRGGGFAKLRQVLVYPGAFVIERPRLEPSGVLQETRQVLCGESWTQGQVVLSWADALEGAAIDDDGRNVVIHEFAHQLDQEKGYANGAPLLGNRDRYRRWSQVFSEGYRALQQDTALQLPTLLNAYGASDPAEFFAVASEVFFEQPRQLAAEHPALYRELSEYYRVDPLGWE